MKSMFRCVMLIVLLCAVLSGQGVAAPAPELRDITLRLNWYPDGEHSYLYHGVESGIFERAGFRVTIAPGKGSSVSARLVGGGHEEVGIVAAEYVLMGLAKGLDMKVLLTLYHRNPVVIYSLAEKNIKTLSDLYGKRVGVMLDSNTYPQYQGVCRLAHLDRSRITEVPVSGQTALRSVLGDQIDAHVWHTLNGALPLRMSGHKVNEIPLDEHGVKLYGMCVVVGPKLMRDRDAVRRLRGAVVECLKQARANPQAALASMQKHVRLSDMRVDLAKARLFLSWVFDAESRKSGIGYQTTAGWKTTAETLHMMGELEDVSVYKRAPWHD